MAMTDLQTSALRYSESLIARVAVEIARAAQYVLAGGGTPPPSDTMKDKARIAIADPVNETRNFMWYVVTDPQVQENGSDPNATTDAQLQTIVSLTYPKVWV